jgi:uncharacterized protein (TIGR03086 family)
MNAYIERTIALLDDRIRGTRDDQWALPTPCAEWSVRDLVNHVVGEVRWMPPLLDGVTIAEVGTQLDGDLLGTDPIAAWTSARDVALEAARTATEETVVGLSSGPTPAPEYLRQVGADLLIHAWDLAVATGTELPFDNDLTTTTIHWFADVEDAYRTAGGIGPRPEVQPDADAQTRLLAMFGRSVRPPVLFAVERFSAAFDARDVDAIMTRMTSDCVFESTAPPDGERYEGQDAVRAAWEKLFADSPDARFTAESCFGHADNATVRWRYDWAGGHVRGVDVFRVRDGLIAEKVSYVKG